MDKKYIHSQHEKKIYKMWEKGGYFAPSKKGEPYTILMPPPNANASLHAGHAMYMIDDVLVRAKRMQGYSATWIPGMDHAGFETQFVYEKHLKKSGKSRIDYDRETLYNNVFKFVQDNSGLIYKQFKRLGFSADWERSVFTLDDHVLARVHKTFTQMESEGLVYRDSYIVNYCIHCGTSLSELEAKHVERKDPLYYVRYELVDNKKSEPKHVVVATVRTEPIFVDTHLAVNPKDKKTKNLIGRKVLNPLTNMEMEIIGDEYVDPEFGTGVVKLTPAHDRADFEIAKKHNLPIVSAFDLRGHLNDKADEFEGLYVKKARKLITEKLQKHGLIEKIDKSYEHSVSACYKCGNDLEPLTVPNWFIKVAKLKKNVIKSINNNEVKFYPKKYKRHILQWLDNMHDWPISRQIVWGIRIPAWCDVVARKDIQITFIKNGKNISGFSGELLKKHKLVEIEKGLQTLVAPINAKFKISNKKPGKNFLQETDTFDTWFSSGQWPLVTMSEAFMRKRLPTDVMGTLSDILPFWVSRMILFSLYLENKVPFRDVYLWSMVADSKGAKMSKSKGNVVNPIDLVDKYGADALRMSLVFGVAPGGKVILSDDKVRSMRNFANKVWNMARFMNMMMESESYNKYSDLPFYSKNLDSKLAKEDKTILKGLNSTVETVNKSLGSYRFGDAADAIYHFMWDDLADKYIEDVKNRNDKKYGLIVLRYVLINCLKLLHPFMPFVTEAIWSEIPRKYDDPLIISSWPEAAQKSSSKSST
ncbi:valine--tRNA ligase [Patescibacteria group bacterium]